MLQCPVWLILPSFYESKPSLGLVLQVPIRETNIPPLHAYPVKIASTAGKNLASSIPVSLNESWIPDWVAAQLWSDPSSQDWCLLAKLGNEFALAFSVAFLFWREKKWGIFSAHHRTKNMDQFIPGKINSLSASRWFLQSNATAHAAASNNTLNRTRVVGPERIW